MAAAAAVVAAAAAATQALAAWCFLSGFPLCLLLDCPQLAYVDVRDLK